MLGWVRCDPWVSLSEWGWIGMLGGYTPVGRLDHLMLEVGKVGKGFEVGKVGTGWEVGKVGKVKWEPGWELLCDVSLCQRQQSVTIRM